MLVWGELRLAGVKELFILLKLVTAGNLCTDRIIFLGFDSWTPFIREHDQEPVPEKWHPFMSQGFFGVPLFRDIPLKQKRGLGLAEGLFQ